MIRIQRSDRAASLDKQRPDFIMTIGHFSQLYETSVAEQRNIVFMMFSTTFGPSSDFLHTYVRGAATVEDR